MYVLIVKFESSLSEDEVRSIAHNRADEFRALPGLIQKYYIKTGEPNHYGGVYIWDSAESMKSYRESELASSIAEAYQVVGAPNIEILEGIFPLRA